MSWVWLAKNAVPSYIDDREWLAKNAAPTERAKGYVMPKDDLDDVYTYDCGMIPELERELDAISYDVPNDVRETDDAPNDVRRVGHKDDKGKARWDLLPLDTLSVVVDVLTFGAKRYGDGNWKKVDDMSNRYFAATMRHLTEWRGGRKIDKESGLPHLAHAICSLIFCLWDDMRLQ